MKNPQYIHHGIVRNNELIHDRPEMWKQQLHSLEGHRIEQTIEKENESVTISQRGYYFGGIIRTACMNTNKFAGWLESEIHQFFLQTLRSYSKTIVDKITDGLEKETTYHIIEDFSSYSRSEMKGYIEDVLNWLALEEIFPEPPENYKLNKYEYKKK